MISELFLKHTISKLLFVVFFFFTLIIVIIYFTLSLPVIMFIYCKKRVFNSIVHSVERVGTGVGVAPRTACINKSVSTSLTHS